MRGLSSAVTIELFRPRHLKRILEIEAASFPNDPYSAEVFASLHRRCGDQFFVAKRGRRIAGYIVTCVERSGAEVISIAVAPEARRTGIGTRLLEHTLGRLRGAGVTSISLMVRSTSDEANEFYRKFGFQRVRKVADYYGAGADAIRMRRAL